MALPEVACRLTSVSAPLKYLTLTTLPQIQTDPVTNCAIGPLLNLVGQKRLLLNPEGLDEKVGERQQVEKTERSLVEKRFVDTAARPGYVIYRSLSLRALEL